MPFNELKNNFKSQHTFQVVFENCFESVVLPENFSSSTIDSENIFSWSLDEKSLF